MNDLIEIILNFQDQIKRLEDEKSDLLNHYQRKVSDLNEKISKLNDENIKLNNIIKENILKDL